MAKINQQEKTSIVLNSGKLIRATLESKGISQALLARMNHKHVSTIGDQLKRTTIQTNVLWELSLTLKHNFFAEIAALLPADFTPENAALAAKNLEIEQLQQKLERAQSEKELLMQLLKR